MIYFEIVIPVLICLAAAGLKMGFISKSTGDDWVSELIISKRTLSSGVDLDKSVLPLKFYYPPLHYFILSKFSKNIRQLAGVAFNLLYDILSAAAVFIASKLLFSNAGLLADEAFIYALYSMSLFAFSPLLTPVHARIMGLKSRSLGTFISLMYFIFLFGLLYYQYNLLIIPCVIFGILAIMASQFAFQSIVFITPIISILTLNSMAMIPLVLIFVVGLLLPGLDLKNVLKNKVSHFRWYIKTVDTTSISSRGPIRSLKILFKYRKQLKFLDKLEILLSQNPYIIAFLSVPMLIALPFLIYFYSDFMSDLNQDRALYLSIIFTASGLLIFALTSFRPFLVAGEAERYLEPILLFINFSVLLLISKIHGQPWPLVSCSLLLNLIVIALFYVVINRSEFSNLYGDTAQIQQNATSLLEFLETNADKFGKTLKVVTAPTKLTYLLSSYSKRGAVEFLFSMGYSEKDKFDWMLEAFPHYLHLREDIIFYRDKYSVDLAVISKSLVHLELYQSIIKNYPVIAQNPDYVIVSTTPNNH